MKRSGWQRLSQAGRTTSGWWKHMASGWMVQHCGHMTANWPYYLVDPAHPGCCTVTHNGKGYRTLKEACEAVEAILAGTMRTTSERCVGNTRVVVPS